MNGTSIDPTGGFTLYHCEVTERKVEVGESARRWCITKRYSDFVTLHTLLKEVGYKVDVIENALPPKKWFGNLEGDVISFRQRALERYLQLCLNTASPDDCTAVRLFLENNPTKADANRDRFNLPLPLPSPTSSRRESATDDNAFFGGYS
jgi:hypothetical protein